MEDAALCHRRLTFGIDDRWRTGMIAEMNRLNIAVHPLDAVHFDPLQAPRATACVRRGDHSYHWDGQGTWWTDGAAELPR